jgi:hypothetical protein
MLYSEEKYVLSECSSILEHSLKSKLYLFTGVPHAIEEASPYVP